MWCARCGEQVCAGAGDSGGDGPDVDVVDLAHPWQCGESGGEVGDGCRAWRGFEQDADGVAQDMCGAGDDEDCEADGCEGVEPPPAGPGEEEGGEDDGD